MTVRTKQGQVSQPGPGLTGDMQRCAVVALDVIRSMGAVLVAEVEGAQLASDLLRD
jgi:hypothetical protein